MSRLPTPGGDTDIWGDVLNDYLSVSLDTDGSIRPGAIAGKANDSSVVHNAGNETVAGVKTFSTSPVVPSPSAGTDAANKSYVDGVTAAGAPDASPSIKGIVLLSNDLGGTATAPTVPGLAGKIDKSTVTTKGDLLAATAGGAVSRLGVGSDAQVLTADSTQAAGLKWSTPSTTDPNAVHHGDLVLNVRDYGAVGDGAADDTTAIQNAINAAAAVAVGATSTGATVYFPAGTYKISAALTLGASSLTFRGEGFRSSTIQQVTAGTHAFFAQNHREFVFSDLKIQGQGSGAGDGIYLSATGSYAVFDCEFNNLLVTSFGRHGIHTEDLCASNFTHVRVDSCGGDGFHIGDNGSSQFGGTSMSFISCYANACGNAGYYLAYVKYTNLSACATDSCNYGYFTSLCSGVAFNACGVEATSGSAGHGYMITNGSTSVALNACWGTNIAATTGIGINITANGGSTCSRIVVTASRIQGGITPLYSAQVDTNCQAVFVGFQPHPSVGLNVLGNAQFVAHDNTGLSSYGQAPVATDEPYVAWMGAAASYGFGAAVKGDGARRWAVRADGKTDWGDGTSARDTNLYRSAASTLRTDATFVAANINIGSPSAAAKLYATYADSGTASLGIQMVETASTLNGSAMQVMEAAGAGKRIFDIKVTGDTSRRLSINAAGTVTFGDGTALDTNVYRSAADTLATDDDLAIRVAGKGLRVKEGSNAKMGTATLTAGSVTVANTSVTANSRIFLTIYIAGGTVGALYVSAKSAGTSFSVASTSATDTSTFNYLIVEPAA